MRSVRVHLDIEAGAPKILIPHSSNSTDILVVNLGTLSVSNTFTLADEQGTVSEREAAATHDNAAAMTQSVYGSLEHDWRADGDEESPLASSPPAEQKFNVLLSDSNSTLCSFFSALGTPVGSTSMTGIASATGGQKVSPPAEAVPDPADYKCLLDVMQVVLVDIDLFAAQWRCKEHGGASGAGGAARSESAPDLLEFPSYFVQRQVRN